MVQIFKTCLLAQNLHITYADMAHFFRSSQLNKESFREPDANLWADKDSDTAHRFANRAFRRELQEELSSLTLGPRAGQWRQGIGLFLENRWKVFLNR